MQDGFWMCRRCGRENHPGNQICEHCHRGQEKVVGIKVSHCRCCGAKVRYTDLTDLSFLCVSCLPKCVHPERARTKFVPGDEWCSWCRTNLTEGAEVYQLREELEALQETVNRLRSGIETWPHDDPKKSKARAARLLGHS